MSDDHTLDRELDQIAVTLRALDPEDLTLVDPPTDLWDRIAAEIGETPASPAPRIDQPTIASLDDHRRRRHMGRPSMLLAAAAAVLVVAGALVITATRGNDTTVVATAVLGYDADQFDELGAAASARVRLLQDDGSYLIAFDAAELPTTDEPADLELWLIEPDEDGSVADLVSLGIIDATDHTFAVPAGYDPDQFSVVDISVEPRDGDAQHSGRSILRGALST